ncbi:hypothetical protein [Leifsonia aquatica]|uniref:hypothetical protein n=1 Tax=Leifsonia aquatica TaxID=144185 RepID=UPI0004687738|nr:hypothetical protein [Leifsonia aquatica]
MTTADPNAGVPAAGWPQQPVAPQQPTAHQQPQPPYAGQPHPQWQQPAAPAPATRGSILRRWPVWAQNTAIVVGAVAVLAIVFFAGFFTGHATGGGARGGFGTTQNVEPRPFGGQNGDSSGSGTGGMGGFGGGSGSATNPGGGS